MNTRFPLFKLFLISSIIISISACANGSDDPISKTDIWANAKTAIDAIDVSYDVSSSTQSSRSALGEITSVDGTKNVTFYDYNADPNSNGIGYAKRGDYTNKILSGQSDVTQCILNMTKGEIRNGIPSLGFNSTFTKGRDFTEIAPVYDIDGSNIKVDLQVLYIKHETGSNLMYIYSLVNTTVIGPGLQGKCYSVLKCTENSKGTLDTNLYMVNGTTNITEWNLVRFDCTAGQKLKKSYHKDYKGYKWDDLTITSAGISGYKFKDRSTNEKTEYESYCINLKGSYCAVYQQNRRKDDSKSIDSTSYEKFVTDENGLLIQHQDLNSSKVPLAGWEYYLNFISELQSGTSGYIIKLIDGSGDTGTYKLYKDNIEGPNVYRQPYNYDGKFVYTYYLRDTSNFTRSVGTIADSMMSTVEGMSFKDGNQVSTSSFDTSLPEKLTAWCTSIGE